MSAVHDVILYRHPAPFVFFSFSSSVLEASLRTSLLVVDEEVMFGLEIPMIDSNDLEVLRSNDTVKRKKWLTKKNECVEQECVSEGSRVTSVKV